MKTLDETDRQILRLLLEDARRPYSDIADHVDLSPPAVSDRIERLREAGVIRRFTVDIDRSTLRDGTPVLVRLSLSPDAAADAAAAISERDAVEHVFHTADGTVAFHATVRSLDLTEFLDETVDPDLVRDMSVDPLVDAKWSPDMSEATLALSCAECGNTVTDEGTAARMSGDLYHFCCEVCEDQFVDHFEDLRQGA